VIRSEGKDIVGVILAGGDGVRIGGRKAQRLLHGKPLLEHVAGRLRPQVNELWLSTRREDDDAAKAGLRVIEDDSASPRAGPLGGIMASLRAAFQEGLALAAIVPCDAPFLPIDIVADFADALDRSNAPAIVARTAAGLQPTFGLWRTSIHPQLEAALSENRLRLTALSRELGVAALDIGGTEVGELGLFNINTAADLAAAASFSTIEMPPASPVGRQ
jgi:molybdopterin-guanine dinucleotide biosynthesis protein A